MASASGSSLYRLITKTNLDQKRFEGKLTTEKWAKLAKTSHDTALRDIQDLIRRGVLKQEESGGRSTAYTLIHEAS